jgi:hypothetical protein
MSQTGWHQRTQPLTDSHATWHAHALRSGRAQQVLLTCHPSAEIGDTRWPYAGDSY